VKNLDKLLALPFTGLKLDKGIVRLIGTLGPGSLVAPLVLEQARARGTDRGRRGCRIARECGTGCVSLGVQEAQGLFSLPAPSPPPPFPYGWEDWRATTNG